MKHILMRYAASIAVLLLAQTGNTQTATPPADLPTSYNCSKMYSTPANETYKLDPRLIEYCIQRGWDPPGANRPHKYNWQPVGGKPVRAGGGSLQIGGKQPPSNPPGTSNTAKRSSSSASIAAGANLPSSASSQCFMLGGQNVCEQCSSDGTGCNVQILNPINGRIELMPSGEAAAHAAPARPENPVAVDMANRFGRITRIRGGQATLVCGGTMTLSGTEVAGVLNANYLLIARELEREVEVYRRQNATNFAFLRKVKLAKDYCGVSDDDKTRPAHQFIFFNATQPFVALRVVQPSKLGDTAEAGVLYNTLSDEKFVVIPPAELINGRSKTPGCEEFERYPANIPDFRMSPTTSEEDETAILPLNTESCQLRTLHLDLTTPNLVHQPNTNARMLNIAGQPEVAVETSKTSIIATQPEAFFRVGIPGATFVFTGHTIMDLPEIHALHMYGPTTFVGGAAAITLEGGGHITNEEGDIVQRIAPGTRYVPPGLTPPYYVLGDNKVYMPENITLIGAPAGIIREPTDPPPNADPQNETPGP